MAKTQTYEGMVPNYHNDSKHWRLAVFEDDGQVGVGLSPEGEGVEIRDPRESLMEIEEAERVLAGFQKAIERARAKLRR